MKQLCLLALATIMLFGNLTTAMAENAKSKINYGGPETYKIYFFSSSKDIANLQKIKNCISYAVCTATSEVFAGDSESYRLHVRGAFTSRDLENIVRECPRSELPDNLKVYDESFTPAKEIALDWTNTSEQISAYKKARPNLFLKNMNAEDYKTMIGTTKKYLSNNQPDLAISSLIKSQNLNGFGYTVKTTADLASGVAVTDHKTNTISFGKAFYDSPEDLLYGIRHELEHAQQIHRANLCRLAAGQRVSLAGHGSREKSAYLNDALNSAKVCGPDKACNMAIQINSEENFLRYLTQP